MMTSIGASGLCLIRLQELDTVELGHFQIGDDHIEPPGRQFFDRFFAVGAP